MADNWAAGISQAGQKYAAAIDRVQVNPAALAATPEAMQAWIQGCQNSMAKRAAKLASVDFSFWKQQTKQYGAANYAASGQKGKAKYNRGVAKMGSAYADASAAAHAITGPKSKARAMARVSAVIDVLQAAAKH